MEKFNHIVYWIYNVKKHTDALTQGYVGVTTQPLQHRLQFHKSRIGVKRVDGGNPALARYLENENLDDIKIRPISRKLPEDLAYGIEETLRPEYNIGWNAYKGGSRPGISRPIIITDTEGVEHHYKSIGEAARAGYNRGNLQQVLKGKRPKLNYGCTARYAQ